MKLYKFLIFLLALATGQLYAQDSLKIVPLSKVNPARIKTDEYGSKYYYDAGLKAKVYEINGETVLVMDDIMISKKPRFNNQLDQNYYYFINKKLVRVYPLFLTALDQYRDIQTKLQGLDANTKHQYTRQLQQELANKYEAQLRDLTTSEGRVFAKLMSRATGKTVYEIIRELRGGWSAFWWNVKGRVADVDLKAPYDPHSDRTDQYLESLLQTHWGAGTLRPYPGYEDFRRK